MEFEKIKEIIVGAVSCDAEKVTPEAKLAEDLDIDSLAAVELAMALEENCGVTIPDEELTKFETVGDIVNYLNANA